LLAALKAGLLVFDLELFVKPREVPG